MKGIILAGGHGTRLRPLTNYINKNLLPVGKEPMVLYPLRKLKEAGITEICMTCGSDHMGDLIELCKSGKEYGVDITYRVQEEALGIAHAISLCESFVGNSDFCVILGDNVFDGSLVEFIKNFKQTPSNLKASVCVVKVPDPQRFGVVEYNLDGSPLQILEKPTNPPSNDAVVGVYAYSRHAFDVIKKLSPSARGEYEVTDLNNFFVKENLMRIHHLEGEWIDCGTFDSLHRANQWAYSKG